MAKASTLLKSKPLRIMLLGFPGSGKTGSLAPLANAGFKLRILDFDGNLDPMLRRLTPQGPIVSISLSLYRGISPLVFHDSINRIKGFAKSSGNIYL